MKKIVTLALIGSLILSCVALSGCGKSEQDKLNDTVSSLKLLDSEQESQENFLNWSQSSFKDKFGLYDTSAENHIAIEFEDFGGKYNGTSDLTVKVFVTSHDEIAIQLKKYGNSYEENYGSSQDSRIFKFSELDKDTGYTKRFLNSFDATIQGGSFTYYIKSDYLLERLKKCERLRVISNDKYGDIEYSFTISNEGFEDAYNTLKQRKIESGDLL